MLRVVVAAVVLAVVVGVRPGSSVGGAGDGRVGGLRLPARVQGVLLAVAHGSKFVPHFWAGVNLGSTVPEQQAARMDAQMMEDLRREGYAGGIMFEWIDE